MKKHDFKNTIYIPGWMDKACFYPEFKSLEIWENNIDFNQKLETEFVVAHSLGTHFALLNWKKNKNTKLILINPLLIKRPLGYWVSKWMEYFSKEGKGNINRERASVLKRPVKLFEKTKYLLRDDFLKIVKKIPREKITVIRGENDNFFCDSGLEKILLEMGVRVIVVPGMGHIWKRKILSLIAKIINE